MASKKKTTASRAARKPASASPAAKTPRPPAKSAPAKSAPAKEIPPPRGPTCEEIALCAYGIWEREGRPEGRDAEHWLLAEALLRQTSIET